MFDNLEEKTMPLVKTETIDLHGGDFLRKIKWDGRREYFYSSLPKYVADVLENQSVRGHTLKEVRTRWDAEIEKYDKLKKTERKVIVFEYEGDVDIEKGEPDPPDDEDGHCWGQDMRMEVKIELSYWVGFEVATPSEKTYRDIHGHGKSVDQGRYNNNTRVIEWTHEREAFFAGMIDSLKVAHDKAEKFFNTKPKSLLDRIDSGTKLLTMGGE